MRPYCGECRRLSGVAAELSANTYDLLERVGERMLLAFPYRKIEHVRARLFCGHTTIFVRAEANAA